MITRKLNGRFDRFRARVAEINFLGLFAGSHGGEPLREGHESFIIKIRAGNVDQFGGLLLNRFHPARSRGARWGLRSEGADFKEMVMRPRHDGFGDEVKRRIMLGTYALS